MDGVTKVHGATRLQVTAIVMVFIFQLGAAPVTYLSNEAPEVMESTPSNQIETYSLYLSTGNNLSTVLPDEGGQLESSALDTTVEFTTGDLM